MTRRAATRPPRTVHADALADALASAKGDGASLADWCEWRCRVCHADLTPAQVHLREGRVYCADHGPRDGVAWPVEVLADDVPNVLVEALAGGHRTSVYARVARATHDPHVLCVELRDGTTPYRDRYGWPATPEGMDLARARVDAILADADARGAVITRRESGETAEAFGARHRAAVRAQRGGV